MLIKQSLTEAFASLFPAGLRCGEQNQTVSRIAGKAKQLKFLALSLLETLIHLRRDRKHFQSTSRFQVNAMTGFSGRTTTVYRWLAAVALHLSLLQNIFTPSNMSLLSLPAVAAAAIAALSFFIVRLVANRRHISRLQAAKVVRNLR